MQAKSLAGGLGIILIGVVIWYFVASTNTANAPTVSQHATTTAEATMGTYSYQCGNGIAFTMTPASDMGSIALAPTGGSSYPPSVTLYREPAPAGVRFVGNGILFSGRGETVTLNMGSSTISCNPLPSQTEAPFNFGD